MDSILSNFNVYDIICGGAIVIGIMYGLSHGILSMIKPLLSVIIARTLSSAIRNALKVSDIASTINQAAAEKTGLPADMELIQMGSNMVADAVISVLAFVISYIIIRITLSLVFSAFRFPRFSAAYKLDRVAGAVVGFVIVGFFIYYIGIGAAALGHLGFTSASSMAEGISNSIVASKIVSLFNYTVAAINTTSYLS